MTHAPPMDWNIPFLPEGFYAVAVPPVAIEISVAKSENLSQNVERGMEEPIEEEKPSKMIPNGESQDSLGEGRSVHHVKGLQHFIDDWQDGLLNQSEHQLR